MSKHLEKAKFLREQSEKHYNCAQTVLMSFSDETGLSDEQAEKVAADFGGGFKRGDTCGSICGGLMVLGFLGLTDPENIEKIFDCVKEGNEGCSNCRDLVALTQSRGLQKKPCCDALIYKVIETIEKLV